MGASTILVIVIDLIFQSRVQEQARALGFNASVADSEDAVHKGLATTPSLVVLDLHAVGAAAGWRANALRSRSAHVPTAASVRGMKAGSRT